MLRVIRQLADSGITMVIVTHEIPFAMEIADRLVLMKDGRVADDAPPGVRRTTSHPAAIDFMRHLRSIGDDPHPAGGSPAEAAHV